MTKFDPSIVGRVGTTRHGERVRAVGSAMDPARVAVVPTGAHVDPKMVETFTPMLAHVEWDAIEETDDRLIGLAHRLRDLQYGRVYWATVEGPSVLVYPESADEVESALREDGYHVERAEHGYLRVSERTEYGYATEDEELRATLPSDEVVTLTPPVRIVDVGAAEEGETKLLTVGALLSVVLYVGALIMLWRTLGPETASTFSTVGLIARLRGVVFGTEGEEPRHLDQDEVQQLYAYAYGYGGVPAHALAPVGADGWTFNVSLDGVHVSHPLDQDSEDFSALGAMAYARALREVYGWTTAIAVHPYDPPSAEEARREVKVIEEPKVCPRCGNDDLGVYTSHEDREDEADLVGCSCGWEAPLNSHGAEAMLNARRSR